MDILFLNFMTFAVAISAFVFSCVLTKSGMILNRVDEELDDRLPQWLYKPLIGCQYCVAGQWALWFFLYHSIFEHGSYSFYFHVWFVMQTIFITEIITEFYFRVLKK